MKKYIKKKLFLISFVCIPIIYFWNPHWLGFIGVQPYWPLFWLLLWSIIYGSFNGFIAGLFLGLTLDSISLDIGFTQIPGLVLCGIWFGKLRDCSNFIVRFLRYGLVCFISSFFCGTLYFAQVLLKNISDTNLFIYSSSLKNIFAQAFITGLLGPIICSWLLGLHKFSKEKT